MTPFIKKILILSTAFLACLYINQPVFAQSDTWHASTDLEDRPLFTPHFEASEFADRRAAVMDSIGTSAIAVIQGAASPNGFLPIRQNNEFYYLSGIESPHTYLILDGNTRQTTLFLPDRDEQREFNEGKVLSYEDSTLIRNWSGIDHIRPLLSLPDELRRYDANPEYDFLFTHQSPYEETALTRSMAYRTLSDRQEDPMDLRPARFEHFLTQLEENAPNLDIEDLDYIMDEMRRIKSDAELALIETSSRLHGEAILETIRSTEVGVKAYELDAVAKYIYHKHHIQADAYYPLIHIGPDAFMNHYHGSVRPAKDGDMILMDYGVHYNYYTSDMARMWPANGKFNPIQRELYTFYLTFYENILDSMKPGQTPQQIIKAALEKTDTDLEGFTFTEPRHEEAARLFIDSYRRSSNNPMMRMGHGVGMAVHDVGNYAVPLEPGMVFVIEPQFRVPDEHIYLRLEDMIVVTEEGIEVITDFVPRDIKSIESLIREEGLLQKHDFRIDE